MADSGSSAAAAIVASILQSNLESYCMLVAVTCVFYEHVTTLDDEVEFVWGNGINCPALLFYLNRWLILLWAISVLLTLAPANTLPNLAGETIEIMLYFVWAAFSATRVHVLTRGSLFWPIAVCVLSLVPVVTNIYTSIVSMTYQMVDIPLYGTTCVITEVLSSNAIFRFTIATRMCVITADLIVIGITWRASGGTLIEFRKVGIPRPVLRTLLRDGSLYFVILLILNVWQIIGNATGFFIFTVGVFGTPVCSIIISRFLFGLRRAAVDREMESSLSASQCSSKFSHIIFNRDDMSGDVLTPLDRPQDTASRIYWEEVSAPSSVLRTREQRVADVDVETYCWKSIDIEDY
ncbi:hypothetical protein CERSUDRAFT_75532 [Gelatoporia subvermispora B]|uniref:DUF6533 domain-containing protein n=1 Tax=Ceriporiopsis subvermispora (strain B) TaxID=914234 RepID=M2PF80_CERS8|nr:hypothetical protein CERSUDRAFT_75532 [Gelatoporia subvermispora B]